MTDPTDFLEVAEQIDRFLRPEPDGPQARTRDRILRAATELFVAYGYRKTSVEDVAGAAGVAKGTVYLYYRSKAELLLHAIALQKREYLVELAPGFDASRPPAERLREILRLGLVLAHEMPLLHRASAGDHEIEEALREVDAGTMAQVNDMQVGYFVELIAAATPGPVERERLEERAKVLVDLVFAIVNGGRMLRDGPSRDAYAAMAADVIVRGIIAPAS